MVRYEVVRELGRGGMGVVYLARDTELGRDVALKMLLDVTLAAGDRLARFRREVKLCAELAHPNIVRVFDSGVLDGRPFFTMEIVSGQDLENLSRRGERLGVERVIDLIAQAGDALAYMHARGLCHRDIKPANLMETDGGRLIVMDFGLARGATSTVLTREGTLVGTPRFMAPEVLAGADFSPAQDVYALGWSAHEVLTGKHWIESPDLQELLRGIMQGEFPSLADLRPDVPAWLIELQARAVSRVPANRPTAAEYRDALRAGRASCAPSSARPKASRPSSSVPRPGTVPRSISGAPRAVTGRAPRPAGARRLTLPALAGLAVVACVAIALLARAHRSGGWGSPDSRPVVLSVGELLGDSGEGIQLEFATDRPAAITASILALGQRHGLKDQGPATRLHRYTVDPLWVAGTFRVDVESTDGSVLSTRSLEVEGLGARPRFLMGCFDRCVAQTTLPAWKELHAMFDAGRRERSLARVTEWVAGRRAALERLLTLAPVVLSSRAVDLASKRRVYDALARVRVIDSLILEYGVPVARAAWDIADVLPPRAALPALGLLGAESALGAAYATSRPTLMEPARASRRDPDTVISLREKCLDLGLDELTGSRGDVLAAMDVVSSQISVYKDRTVVSSITAQADLPEGAMDSAERAQIELRIADTDFWHFGDALWMSVSGRWRFLLLALDFVVVGDKAHTMVTVRQEIPLDLLGDHHVAVSVSREFYGPLPEAQPYIRLCALKLRLWRHD